MHDTLSSPHVATRVADVPALTRRAFMRRVSVPLGAAALGLGFYVGRVEPHWLEVVERALPIRNLPPALAGRILLHVSDIHVGPRVDSHYLMDSFRLVARYRPDIVVVTGDFISRDTEDFDEVRQVLDVMPRGRLATLGVLGNHDYGWEWNSEPVAARLVASVAPLGVRVLRNEIADVMGLQVAGLDDLWGPRFGLEPTLRALDPARASLVLSHNPDALDVPGWDGYSGWILSGHTHGGQCKAPFLPPPLLPVKNYRYTAGEMTLSGDRRVYISRALGHWYKVRFNVRPELTVFTLQTA